MVQSDMALSLKDARAKLRTVRSELTHYVDVITKAFFSEDVVYELMCMRHYNSEAMFNTLCAVGMFRFNTLSDLLAIANVDKQKLIDWGITLPNGFCGLEKRFVVPIRAVNGEVVALVGYYPDSRKYITTPTFGFSREACFFNSELYESGANALGCDTFLVEGIFDSLSLRSLGFPALGNMGLPLSVYKRSVLRRYKNIIAIPDNDLAGMSTIPMLNKLSGKTKKNIWMIDNPHVFVRLPKGVKDIDDLVKGYDCAEALSNACHGSLIYKIAV